MRACRPHLLLLCSLFLAVGCSSFPAWKGKYAKAPVLVLPPKDVVQGGAFHTVSPGSGRTLLDSVKRRLDSKGWEVMETDDPRFVHTLTPSREEAAAEARRLGATYALVLELGEFLNAAPFTFRKDFATLETGLMVEAANAEPVWRLERPLSLAKSNIGNHLVLIERFGTRVADSIAKVPKP